MLLWTTLLCLFSANLVASQSARPGVLVEVDPGAVLKPKNNAIVDSDSSDNVNVIRGLLMVRQTGCPAGYGECTNPAGRCCPVGGSCCQTTGCCEAGYFCYSTGCCQTGYAGCEGNSCCSPTESCCSGGGCCDTGTYCAVVNGQSGCCQNGKTCTNDTPQCTDAGYVLCPTQDFCCPVGYTCFRDSANNPECTLGNAPPPTLNNPPPTATYVPPPLTSTKTQGPPVITLPNSNTKNSSPSPSPNDSGSGSSGAASSALSNAINAFLTFFAGVGTFVYLS